MVALSSLKEEENIDVERTNGIIEKMLEVTDLSVRSTLVDVNDF